MPNHSRALDAERSEECVRVAGELLEGELVSSWFARFAKADLVRRNHPVTRFQERFNGVLPGGGAEILAVQQDGSTSIWSSGHHVQICHFERLALGLEAVDGHGPRVIEPFETRAIHGAGIGRRFWRGGLCLAERSQCPNQQENPKPDSDIHQQHPIGRLCLYRKKINLSTCLAGQAVGIKEVDDGIWLVSFMDYDHGYIDLEEKTLQPLNNPFGAKVLPMS
jgi:hypothetical protein